MTSEALQQYNREYMRDYRKGLRRSAERFSAVVKLAREDHELRCGCNGEACQLGEALARVP